MASSGKPLREEIKRRFYPFVMSHGFTRQKSENPFFTTFVREYQGRTDVFDIQWDHYWRPFFVINFGSKQGEFIGRLQRRRGGALRNWFSLRRPWFEKLRYGKWNYTPQEVTDELISAFEELEIWWKSGITGPHVYII
jgi:hypothetical protein